MRQYESISFADAHAPVMHLLPRSPARVLDIGAGTGRDAAGFAALGHSVTAVEPTAELRKHAIKLHASPRIEWLDDSLPELSLLSERSDTFDVVMLTAVWMHLDEQQRRHAMPRVAALVRPGGVMTVSLRHGPVPEGRRMSDVTAAETIGLAQAQAMICVQHLEAGDGLLKRRGVTWDRLAFRKDDHPGQEARTAAVLPVSARTRHSGQRPIATCPSSGLRYRRIPRRVGSGSIGSGQGHGLG